MTAEDWIQKFSLEPLPEEGGWFCRTFTGSAGDNERAGSSSIYALFTSDQFSALHRLDADEVFCYHAGDAFRILKLENSGQGKIYHLGLDLAKDQTPQVAFPRGCWFGGKPEGGKYGYTLLSAVVAPEFQWKSFELGDRKELQERFPDWADEIEALTRE